MLLLSLLYVHLNDFTFDYVYATFLPSIKIYMDITKAVY